MAKHASDTSSMELTHYATILRRRWRVVVIGLAAGVVLACAVVLLAPSRFTATTSVNVNLINSNAFSASRPPSDLVDAETEQAMARSTTVMSNVATELGGEWTKATVRRSTTATLVPDGTVLRVEFTGSSPREAARGAALVAEEYLTYRSDLAQGRVDVVSERLVVRRDKLQKQLASANREVAGAPEGSADQTSADLARQNIVSELATVTEQLNDLQAVNTSGGEVLTEADPAQVTQTPRRAMSLVSGFLGGLMLGLVGAFVVNTLDRRVWDAYDVAGAGGGAVVARLRARTPDLPAADEDADQVRALRERLMAAEEDPHPVFAVVDVAPRTDAPTDVAANLALSLADAGTETTLLLAAYPKAVVERVAAALGMSEVEGYGVGRRFRGGLAPSLTLLEPVARRSRLAPADVMAELLADGARSAEVTVVAVAPAAGSAVRLTAGRAAHQVVLAVREHGCSIDDLAVVCAELEAVWSVVLGTVLLPDERQLPVADEAVVVEERVAEESGEPVEPDEQEVEVAGSDATQEAPGQAEPVSAEVAAAEVEDPEEPAPVQPSEQVQSEPVDGSGEEPDSGVEPEQRAEPGAESGAVAAKAPGDVRTVKQRLRGRTRQRSTPGGATTRDMPGPTPGTAREPSPSPGTEAGPGTDPEPDPDDDAGNTRSKAFSR